jgi:hypothetical protein
MRKESLRGRANFLNQFNMICLVQSYLQKCSASPQTQITSISPAVRSHREGRIAIVTDAGLDAVDAAALGAQVNCRAGFDP